MRPPQVSVRAAVWQAAGERHLKQVQALNTPYLLFLPTRRAVAEQGLSFQVSPPPDENSLPLLVGALIACGRLATILLGGVDREKAIECVSGSRIYKLAADLSWGFGAGLAGLATWCGQHAQWQSQEEAVHVVHAGAALCLPACARWICMVAAPPRPGPVRRSVQQSLQSVPPAAAP